MANSENNVNRVEKFSNEIYYKTNRFLYPTYNEDLEKESSDYLSSQSKSWRMISFITWCFLKAIGYSLYSILHDILHHALFYIPGLIYKIFILNEDAKNQSEQNLWKGFKHAGRKAGILASLIQLLTVGTVLVITMGWLFSLIAILAVPIIILFKTPYLTYIWSKQLFFNGEKIDFSFKNKTALQHHNNPIGYATVAINFLCNILSGGLAFLTTGVIGFFVGLYFFTIANLKCLEILTQHIIHFFELHKAFPKLDSDCNWESRPVLIGFLMWPIALIILLCTFLFLFVPVKCYEIIVEPIINEIKNIYCIVSYLFYHAKQICFGPSNQEGENNAEPVFIPFSLKTASAWITSLILMIVPCIVIALLANLRTAFALPFKKRANIKKWFRKREPLTIILNIPGIIIAT